MMIRFDESLPAIVDICVREMGICSVSRGDVAFLRDAAGVITVIVSPGVADLQRSKLDNSLLELKSYIDPFLATATALELSDDSVADLRNFQPQGVTLSSGDLVQCFYMDRRIVGGDWMRRISSPIPGAPPVVAFSSLKGGVGRSTALTLLAAALSKDGLRVLAIDLDLEAPGLGSFLLPLENRPEFGVLDYYAERGPSAFSNNELRLMIEATPLINSGAPVYVAPAIGTRSLLNPQNVLGKLARSYIEEYQGNESASFLARTRSLIAGFAALKMFDVILIDSRAGLHETAATPLLGLGADVLLFGTFQQQTFEGYSSLLSHIRHFSADPEEVISKFRMVHAKADTSEYHEMVGFLDASHSMFSEHLYGRPEQSVDEFETTIPKWFNVDDPDGPHHAWVIADSRNYRVFEPERTPSQLNNEMYWDSFGDFISNVRALIMQRLEQ